MIDSHCHLDLQPFAQDLPDVIARAQSVGVSHFHIPGSSVAGWLRQRLIANQYQNIDYSCGIHPYFLTPDYQSAITELKTLIVNGELAPCAIGEIGLDGAIATDMAIQQAAFELQLRIALELDIPIIMHHRKSQHLLLQSIKRVGFHLGGVLHAFTGSVEMAQRFIDAGFLLGVGGGITYPRAQKTRATIKKIDLNHMVLETDSPDMPLNGFQGQRNEPSYLSSICEALSLLKQLPAEQVADVTSHNYLRTFRRPL